VLTDEERNSLLAARSFRSPEQGEPALSPPDGGGGTGALRQAFRPLPDALELQALVLAKTAWAMEISRPILPHATRPTP
jgi:hypothetical protein